VLRKIYSQWVVAYQMNGEGTAREEGVSLCCGCWGGRIVVCGFGEEVEGGFGVGVLVGHCLGSGGLV
jgi:hypothetical protein